MHVSTQKLSPKRKQDLTKQFCFALSKLDKPDHIHSFLKDFLSSSEYLALSKRLHIAKMLDDGASYELIAKRLKVSTATISAVAESRRRQGWQAGLKTLKTSGLSRRITQLTTPKWGKMSPWRRKTTQVPAST